MKSKLLIVISCSLILLSCGSSKNSNSSISTKLVNQLVGYWISTNSDYQLDENTNKVTTLYYEPIDKNKEGEYIQGENKMRYRVVDTYDYYKKIVVAIYFANGRERIETLTFSENYTRIKNNLITPDNYSIDTYYIKENEE